MNKKDIRPTVFYSPLYAKASEYLFHSKKSTVFTRIAAGIIDKINEFPNVNIEELALYCNTTSPSVTKFCRLIGYNSFSELRNNINHFNSRDEPLFLHDERTILDNVYRAIPKAECLKLSSALAKKKKIVIITNEFTFNISNLLKESISNLERTVYQVHRENDDLIKWLLKDSDCVLVLTFTGEWMSKRPWCEDFPSKLSLYLISAKVPDFLSERVNIWVPLNNYPYLMASSYHSNKYMESVAYVVSKNVIEIS